MEYWKQLRQCFGTERFIITAAAGAIVSGGKVLLVKSKSLGVWGVPKPPTHPSRVAPSGGFSQPAYSQTTFESSPFPRDSKKEKE
jgi:hypothetical protein